MKRIALLALAGAAFTCLAGPDADKIKAGGRKFTEDRMQGFDRIVFEFEGCEAWLVEPKTPTADGRWVWCMEWPTAFQERTGVRELLAAGYRWVAFNPAHVGILDKEKNHMPAGNQSDEMIARRGRLQEYLVNTLGLNPRCGLVGMSWGGYYSVRYASTLPWNVVACYLDAPLLDFSTLTGFAGDAKPGELGRTGRQLQRYYDFVKPGYVGKDDPFQSVNRAEPIARAGIPVLLLYGAKDATVPVGPNCLRFADAFEKAGGTLTLVRRSAYGHHPHGVDPKDASMIVNFFDRAYTARPKPRVNQMKRIRAGVEIYGIVHWGLNTFTDREWGFGDENPKDLDPAKFDADQIVGACRDGGLQGLIIVSKHHDGFCLWPTKTTEHNISKSPFRGGKGDYVREMSDACRRAGLRFGVYVSPWDRNNAAYASEKYVTDVFQRQIAELLSGAYGEVFEMWFDGANGGDGYYGGAREKRRIPAGYYRYDTETFAMVRRLQPNVCIFNEGDDADFRFGGNEQGLVDPSSRATGGHYDGKWENYRKWCNKGLVEGSTYHTIEADFPLRKGWFYHAKEKGTTKSSTYLMKLYLSSVGNAATMNIGIAPNREGLLDEDDVRALRGFTAIRNAFFSKEAKDGEPFNVVVMTEDVTNGEMIDDWKVLADGREILSGPSVGMKRIRVLETPLAAQRVELKATSRAGAVGKTELRRYFANPELVKDVLAATAKSGETDTAKWMAVGREGGK